MKRNTVFEFDELEPLLEWLNANLTEKDAVLIKGSHGLRMDRITSMLEARS
jgi:UDP-N-acetylmuramyl pentapeptide synthase